MKTSCVLAAIVFALALSGCGQPDLTADQAKTMINGYWDQHPVTQSLLTGMDNIGTATDAAYFATVGGKYQKALEADGLITITPKPKVVNPANHAEYFNALDIALTAKGKALVTGTPQTVPPPTSNTWATVYENAIFCTKEVAKLGDVTTTDDTASADYSWHAAKVTPFSEDFHKTDSSDKITCNPAVVVNASAAFERKNGVWALTVAQ